MNEERQERLKPKREELREVVSHEDQRKARQALLDKLEANHESYGIIWAENPIINHVLQWVEDNFPFTADGRIDWDKAQDCFSTDWKDESEICEKVSQIISEKQLGNPNVLVIWNDAKSLCLRMHLLAIAKYANSTFWNSDAWIVCQDAAGWVIENNHDGTISFCRMNKWNK
jgi:hypothetical protein